METEELQEVRASGECVVYVYRSEMDKMVHVKVFNATPEVVLFLWWFDIWGDDGSAGKNKKRSFAFIQAGHVGYSARRIVEICHKANESSPDF